VASGHFEGETPFDHTHSAGTEREQFLVYFGYCVPKEIIKTNKIQMKYTKKQGQYLIFIYYYQKLNKQSPAHVDFQKYFIANPASVNDMLKTLERKGFIEREAGKARSIKLSIEREDLPELE